jgi:hypothetical protein
MTSVIWQPLLSTTKSNRREKQSKAIIEVALIGGKDLNLRKFCWTWAQIEVQEAFCYDYTWKALALKVVLDVKSRTNLWRRIIIYSRHSESNFCCWKKLRTKVYYPRKQICEDISWNLIFCLIRHQLKINPNGETHRAGASRQRTFPGKPANVFRLSVNNFDFNFVKIFIS